MRRFRQTSIIIGIAVFIWLVLNELLLWFQCRPVAYQWDKNIKGGHCLDTNLLIYFATAPLDIATNIAILALPMPYLWNLQMPWSRKLATMGLFVLASL